MPLDLDDLLAPAHTAVLTMELQRGVVGDRSRIPALASAVESGDVIGNTAALLSAARSASVPVVHCTAEFRADLAGTPRNSPLISMMTKDPSHILVGSEGVEVVPALVGDGDVVCPRRHGVAPFTGTSLDVTLRSLGVTTVVATGVSLNLAIPGLCIEAVGLGYRVVVASDCVAGTDAEYVLEHMLPLLATVLPSSEIAARWR